METHYDSKVLDHLGLVSTMYDELGIGDLIDRLIVQDPDQRKVSIGQCVKAMVLNGLGFVNQRLYLVPHFFQNKPTERLLGEGIEPDHLNDNTLGRALDSLHAFGVTELYSQIAVQAMERLGLTPRFGHVDNTSFHTDGVYNSSEGASEGVIHITKGYSRDHRPELNQVALNLIVEHQAGIPLLMKPLDGNSSDKQTLKDCIQEYVDHLQNPGHLEYMVADSALYTADNLSELQAAGVLWISRVPETITAAKTAIQKVTLDDMTPLSEGYRGYPCTSEYGGISQRWLVVHSDAASERAHKTVNKQVLKQSGKECRAFEKLCRKSFGCQTDAEQALNTFKASLKTTEIHQSQIVVIPKYTKRGRPGTDRTPDRYVYQIEGGIATSLEYRRQQQWQKSCFILATNQCNEQELSREEMLDNYKKQRAVEGSFRFLKDPMFLASSFFLKLPERIMALLMVMTVCLLVYAALEFRVRSALNEQKKTIPNQKGKPTQTPTMKWVFQLFLGIHVLIVQHHTQVVLNLNETHRTIIDILGPQYKKVYS